MPDTSLCIFFFSRGYGMGAKCRLFSNGADLLIKLFCFRRIILFSMVIKFSCIPRHSPHSKTAICCSKPFFPLAVGRKTHTINCQNKYQAKHIKNKTRSFSIPNNASFRLQLVRIFSSARGSSSVSGTETAICPFASNPVFRSASSITP